MFIMTEIFPGGRLPSIEMVEEHAVEGGLHAHPQALAAAALRQDPRIWAAALEAQRRQGHRDPVRRGLRALHELPDRLRETCSAIGYIDVNQFTLAK